MKEEESLSDMKIHVPLYHKLGTFLKLCPLNKENKIYIVTGLSLLGLFNL